MVVLLKFICSRIFWGWSWLAGLRGKAEVCRAARGVDASAGGEGAATPVAYPPARLPKLEV